MAEKIVGIDLLVDDKGSVTVVNQVEKELDKLGKTIAKTAETTAKADKGTSKLKGSYSATGDMAERMARFTGNLAADMIGTTVAFIAAEVILGGLSLAFETTTEAIGALIEEANKLPGMAEALETTEEQVDGLMQTFVQMTAVAIEPITIAIGNAADAMHQYIVEHKVEVLRNFVRGLTFIADGFVALVSAGGAWLVALQDIRVWVAALVVDFHGLIKAINTVVQVAAAMGKIPDFVAAGVRASVKALEDFTTSAISSNFNARELTAGINEQAKALRDSLVGAWESGAAALEDGSSKFLRNTEAVDENTDALKRNSKAPRGGGGDGGSGEPSAAKKRQELDKAFRDFSVSFQVSQNERDFSNIQNTEMFQDAVLDLAKLARTTESGIVSNFASAAGNQLRSGEGFEDIIALIKAQIANESFVAPSRRSGVESLLPSLERLMGDLIRASERQTQAMERPVRAVIESESVTREVLDQTSRNSHRR